MNVHNYDLDSDQKRQLRQEWEIHSAWALSDPLRYTFIAMGDFNFSDVPAQSYLVPQGPQRRQTQDGRYQQNQNFWRQLVRTNVVEISSEIPTFFSQQYQTGTTIDRVFIAMPPAFLTCLHCELNVTQDSAALSDRKLSDHAMLKLTIENRKAPERSQRPIPDFIFRSKQYKKLLKKMLNEAELDTMTDLRRFDVTKQIMLMAAELARNELQQLPLGTGD
eukprot:8036403-Pyramimonas_sp.AAC.1